MPDRMPKGMQHGMPNIIAINLSRWYVRTYARIVRRVGDQSEYFFLGRGLPEKDCKWRKD